MVIALLYTAPVPVTNVEVPSDLEYLFGDAPTGNYALLDIDDLDRLYSEHEDFHSDCVSEVDDNFGYEYDVADFHFDG